MSDDGSNLGVLSDLDQGLIDVSEAVRRLEKPSAAEGRPSHRRSDVWWLVPLATGVALLAGGGYLATVGGAWWLLAVPLIVLGIVITVLAGVSSSSPWIDIHVHEGQGGVRGRPVDIHLPVPLHAATWVIRVARPWMPRLEATSVDELLTALEEQMGTDHDLIIEVDSDAGGERVRVGLK